MFNGDAQDEGESNALCGKDLKRYLMMMGVVALVVLFGAFVYRQSSGTGVRLTAMFEQFGKGGNAVNAPVAPAVPAAPVTVAAQQVAPPTAAGAIATLPPVIDYGPAPVGGGVGGGGNRFSEVVNVLRNSVVSVNASSAAGPALPDQLGLPNPDGLPRFANPTTRSVENIGSGVVVRNDGYILTNYHVVRGANSVFVTVQDDVGSTRYAAEIVKMDEALDLALLKVSPKAPLTAAVLGDSDVVRVADEVIAIGTPFGLDMTVSRGIVSAKRKSLVIEGVTHSNLLQTDAAINQGNSGGPLVGTSGAVIGINTAIYTPNGAFAGIGFAVPSNQARLFVLDEVGWLPSSTMEGAQFGLVALPSQGLGGVGSAGPAIIAGTPAPHADGRQNMDCTTCHDVIRGNGPVAQRPANRAVMPVAAVGVPPPPIAMGTVSPHTDGRQAMSCATCHQMLPAAGAAATVAAPGAGAYGFAQAPGSLAINIQAVRNQPAAAAGRVSLMGAAMTEMSASLSQQTGQPVGRGVYLAGVTPGSPMAAAGLRPGDILLKVDGRPVRAPQEASAILSGIPDGRTVRLGILRDGDVRAVDLVAGPAGLAAAAPMPAAPPMSPMPPITGGITGTQRPAAGPVGPAAVAKPPTEFNWLGMEIETFQAAKAAQTGVAGAVPTAAGAQVAEIVPGSRAANAGLLANDVIMEVNNRPVAGPARLDAAIKAAEAAGQQILMKIHRSGQEFYVVL